MNKGMECSILINYWRCLRLGKYIIEIDSDYNEAIGELSKYGKIEKISILLNLFSLETQVENICEIKKIKGVESVNKELEGSLKNSA